MSDEELKRIREYNRVISLYESQGNSTNRSIELAISHLFPGVTASATSAYAGSHVQKAAQDYWTQNALGKMSLQKQRGPLFWLTLNLHKDEDCDAFLDAVHSYLMKTKIVEWYLYSFEQRSVIQGEYSGFHCHILGKRNTDTSDQSFKQQFKNRFKDFIAVNIRNCFHFNWISLEEVPVKMRYILGDKHGHRKEEKLEKVANDIEWRKLNLLEPYYTSWIEEDEDHPIELVGWSNTPIPSIPA